MSSLRRSDAPPSLEAANQAQIDDLVQRNRALEYTNKKLSEKLEAETNRSKDAVLDIQKRWHEQEKLTREECEDFLAYYRFVQLSTVSALETERLNVLGEQKALRKEKLLRLQRDFRITMFHAKERELEERVMELEEENERMILERKELAASLRKKLAELIAQLRVKDTELADSISERDLIEKDVNKLREQNVHLETSLASTSSKLERTNLQLEGAQTSRSQLEGVNEDLKRKNYDLQRQLDKWQRLENKDNEELDSLRKRKSEVEVEVKELRDRLNWVTDDSAKTLDKEKKRIEKMKATTLQWQEAAETQENELKDAKKQLTELRRELEQLKSYQARASSESTIKKTSARSRKAISASDSEPEHEAPRRSKASSRRKKGTASESETDDVQEVPPPTKPSRKPKQMSPVLEEEEAVSEVEIETSPAKAKEKEVEIVKQRPKPRLRTKTSQDIEEPAPAPPASAQPKRKRKASAEDSDVELEKPERKAAKTGAKSERARTTDSATKKSSTRAPSEDPTTTTMDPVQKQKKRKINVFAGAGSQSNQLGGFEFDLGNAGLNIPTSLTPLKEAEGPVPNRAVSGVMSGIGGLIRGRMGGPR
ncbi:hypothetical protein AN958_12184 [Leucoagaricus sp. SymC.cos]|nr:hypothetical protein AN958_12184 [Leucoagaricus sp. SymC.cos]